MKRRILSVLGVLGILVTLSVIIVFAASATVLTTSSRYEHTCSGGSIYSFPYPVLSKDHLVVSKYLTASGFSAATTFTQNQHYTVTLVNNGQSATIALIGGASCATNYTLRIQRTVPVTQTTAFRTQGTYLPIAHENALDKLTMIIQQAQDGISQSAESAAAINDHINGAADPHDMYFILAGRAGGQVGYGGTASGNDLTLLSNTSSDGTVLVGDVPHITVDESADTVTLGSPTTASDTLTCDSYLYAVGGIYGASTSGADLLVGSSTHATKGQILMATNGLVVDEANNCVGIETVNPNCTTYKLDVTGAIFASTDVVLDGTLYGGDGASEGLAINSTSNATKGAINIASNLLYVNEATSRIGVNTASPGYLFDVNGSAEIDTNLVVEGTLYGGDTTAHTLVLRGNSVATDGSIDIGNGTLIVDESPAGVAVAGDFSIDSPTFVVDATNNRVGILDATPDYTLDVEGSAFLGDASSGVLVSTAAGITTIQRQDATGYFAGVGGNAGLVGTVEPGWLLHGSNSTGVNDGEFELRSPNKVDIGVNVATANPGELEVTDGVVTLTTGVNLVVDTDALFVDATAQRVGVNDATPDYTLDVEGTAYVATQLLVGSSGNLIDANATFIDIGLNAIYIDYAGPANVGIYDTTPDALLDVAGSFIADGAATFGSNVTVDTNTLFVDATNNRVGILDATPSYSLDVNGTSWFTGAASYGAQGGAYMAIENNGSTITKYETTAGLTLIGGNGGNIGLVEAGVVLWGSGSVQNGELELRSPSTIDLGIGVDQQTTGVLQVTAGTVTATTGVDLVVDTDALFVDASANRVGIGDATPDYTLDVEGVSAATSFVDASWTFDGEANDGYLMATSGTGCLYLDANAVAPDLTGVTACGQTGGGDEYELTLRAGSDIEFELDAARTAVMTSTYAQFYEPVYEMRPVEAAVVSLDEDDCNKVVVNSGTDVTLPNLQTVSGDAAAAGCQITIVSTGADGTTGLDVTPSADGTQYITGTCGSTVINDAQTDGVGAVNTDGTHKVGDSITVVSYNAQVWYIVGCTGVWN